MDLELSDEQQLLIQTGERFIRDHASRRDVLEWADTIAGLPAGYVAEVAGLGWFVPLAGDVHHGGGVDKLGLAEAAVIAEIRGRHVQPAPFVSASVVASALANFGGSSALNEVLAAVVAGNKVATWAFDWSDPAALVGPGVRAASSGGGVELTGRIDVVEYGADADWILVTGRHSDGRITQAMVRAGAEGVRIERRRSVDLTRRVGRVIFDQVRVEQAYVIGDIGRGAAEARRQVALAAALASAESVGAMDALFEMTRQYALDRVAFGRPIGSFQAIKHQLANLSLSIESSKAVTTMAVQALDEKNGYGAEVASIAKAWTSDAGTEVAQGCFQVFGGIGFAWEHECHLFLRRLTMNALLFGTAEWHREQLCLIRGLQLRAGRDQ
jgi:alkylation response protein AidB-like acyl-CoA dehydrogenase